MAPFLFVATPALAQFLPSLSVENVSITKQTENSIEGRAVVGNKKAEKSIEIFYDVGIFGSQEDALSENPRKALSYESIQGSQTILPGERTLVTFSHIMPNTIGPGEYYVKLFFSSSDGLDIISTFPERVTFGNTEEAQENPVIAIQDVRYKENSVPFYLPLVGVTPRFLDIYAFEPAEEHSVDIVVEGASQSFSVLPVFSVRDTRTGEVFDLETTSNANTVEPQENKTLEASFIAPNTPGLYKLMVSFENEKGERVSDVLNTSLLIRGAFVNVKGIDFNEEIEGILESKILIDSSEFNGEISVVVKEADKEKILGESTITVSGQNSVYDIQIPLSSSLRDVERLVLSVEAKSDGEVLDSFEEVFILKADTPSSGIDFRQDNKIVILIVGVIILVIIVIGFFMKKNKKSIMTSMFLLTVVGISIFVPSSADALEYILDENDPDIVITERIGDDVFFSGIGALTRAPDQEGVFERLVEDETGDLLSFGLTISPPGFQSGSYVFNAYESVAIGLTPDGSIPRAILGSYESFGWQWYITDENGNNRIDLESLSYDYYEDCKPILDGDVTPSDPNICSNPLGEFGIWFETPRTGMIAGFSDLPPYENARLYFEFEGMHGGPENVLTRLCDSIFFCLNYPDSTHSPAFPGPEPNLGPAEYHSLKLYVDNISFREVKRTFPVIDLTQADPTEGGDNSQCSISNAEEVINAGGVCEVCYDNAGPGTVACVTGPTSGCPDGDSWKDQVYLQFQAVPPEMTLRAGFEVRGGERVQCFINGVNEFDQFNMNACGVLLPRVWSTPNISFTGLNTLECRVQGAGGDEDNGFRLRSFYYDSTVAFAPITDLSVESLTEPTDVSEGEVITLSGVIENVGTEDVGAFSNEFSIDLDDNGSYDVTLSGGDISSLLSGNTESVVSSGWTAIEGDHRLRLCADSENDIVEENEDPLSNCLSTAFTVGPPAFPPLVVSCNAVPLVEQEVNQPVTWDGSVFGGSGDFSYLWTGDASGVTEDIAGVTYPTTGLRSSVFRVTDNVTSSVDTANCDIVIIDPPLGDVCDDTSDNDNDGLIDENDPGCWIDGYNEPPGPELEACLSDPVGNGCYDPTGGDENNCGNGICEAFSGENPLVCPLDCAVTGGGEI